MKPSVTEALRYAREEMGHEDAKLIASLTSTSGESLVLVKTREAGCFAIRVVGTEVVDDSVPSSEFDRIFKTWS